MECLNREVGERLIHNNKTSWQGFKVQESTTTVIRRGFRLLYEHYFFEGTGVFPHDFQVCNNVSYYLEFHRL